MVILFISTSAMFLLVLVGCHFLVRTPPSCRCFSFQWMGKSIFSCISCKGNISYLECPLSTDLAVFIVSFKKQLSVKTSMLILRKYCFLDQTSNKKGSINPSVNASVSAATVDLVKYFILVELQENGAGLWNLSPSNTK